MQRVWIVTCVVMLGCGRGGADETRPANPETLRQLLETMAFQDDGGRLFAEGMAELCGDACACFIAAPTGAEDALIDCATMCPSGTRQAAKQAAPGSKVPALAAACGAEKLGLPAWRDDLASVEWLRIYLAGRYLAAQVRRAGARRAAIEAALTKLRIRLPAPVTQTGRYAYRLPVARAARAAVPSTYVILSERGELRAGAAAAVRVDASGAHIAWRADQTLGDEGVPVPVLADLRGALRALRDERTEPITAPEPRAIELDVELGETPEQKARRQALAAARQAGVLRGPARAPGSEFSGLSGTGGLRAGLDDAVAALLGGPAMVVRGDTQALDLRRPLVISDRAASSRRLLEVLAATERGGMIAVDAGGTTAQVFAVTFGGGAGFAEGPRPDSIVLDWGDAALAVHRSPGGDASGSIPSKDGTVDAAAVAQAYAAARSTARAPGDTVAVVVLRKDVPVGALIPVLDAVVASGATVIDVMTDAPPGDDDAPTPPHIRMGRPAAVGELDRHTIRDVVHAQLAKIVECYDRQLEARPDLHGTVATSFFIAPHGAVITASATGVDPDLASCVAGVIKALRFPRPGGGAGAAVRIPFTFRPDGG